MDKALRESRKLHKWLRKRDWFVEMERSPLARAEKEIEGIRRRAIEAEIKRMKQWLVEAQLWATDEMEDKDGGPILATARERQQAQTDARHIRRTIEKLELERVAR